MKIDVEKTPVFVWRSDIAPEHKINNRCIYCNMELETQTYINIEKQDEILIELYKKYLSKWASRKWNTKEKEIINSQIRDEEYNIWYDDYEQNAWDGDEEVGYANAQDYFAPCQAVCLKCGWWINYLLFGNGVGYKRTKAASLLDFDINDSKLTIPEIISHLSKRYSDIYQLSSYRFEEIIAQIYSNMGWDVILTSKTRDGGADIICLGKNNKITLVECKRYSKNRKVSISAIDRLLGVKVRCNADTAHFVTSSYFTNPAIEAAKQIHANNISFKLIDAHELLSLLEIYSDPNLTVSDLKMIFNEK